VSLRPSATQLSGVGCGEPLPDIPAATAAPAAPPICAPATVPIPLFAFPLRFTHAPATWGAPSTLDASAMSESSPIVSRSHYAPLAPALTRSRQHELCARAVGRPPDEL